MANSGVDVKVPAGALESSPHPVEIFLEMSMPECSLVP